MSKREPDWAAVAEALARGEESQHRIAIRFGIPPSTLYYRAKREGWMRPEGTASAGSRRRLVEASSLKLSERPPVYPSTPQARRARMIKRLYKVLEDRFIRMDIENARAAETGETKPAAEQEREDRTIASLVRSFDKLTEVDERTRKAAGNDTRQGSADDDAERLRQELAERFDRLRRAGDGPALPREP